MADIDVNLDITPEQISSYFDGGGWGVIFTLILISLGLFAWETFAGVAGLAVTGYLIYQKMQKGSVSDEDIDTVWEQMAKGREDEAYRVAHIDKDDVIRDAEYFYAWPEEYSPETNYKSKEGEDGFYRRNHQRLVYMIYGKDQLIVFDETICIEDNWDGADQTREYYWKDVSSIGFDQKDNTLKLACGPTEILFPLAGQEEDEDGKMQASDEKFSSVKAEEISNSIRVMLREKKSG